MPALEMQNVKVCAKIWLNTCRVQEQNETVSQWLARTV